MTRDRTPTQFQAQSLQQSTQQPLQQSLQVVVYTDAAGVGGAEISLGHLVATVDSTINITVVGTCDRVVNFIADRRTQSIANRCIQSTRIVLPSQGWRSLLQHWLTLTQLQPDIIHINLCTPWASAIGLACALLMRRSRVVRVDQLPLRTTDALTLWRTRLLSLRVDAHVAVGKASARRMEDFYALGRDTVISIPNGVPDVFASELPPIAIEHQALLSQLKDKGALIVGAIGRLDAMKGHDILLRALAQVEGVQVIILGEGAEHQALLTLANRLGVCDRVHLLGWVDSPQAYLPSFDVVAMPSRSEGFPLAMVEAMLAERPVIATRVGSMPEAIIEEKTGILIEKNDDMGLAVALEKLRDRPNWRMQLGQQARAVAIEHFTVTAMTCEYEELWRRLMRQPQTPRFRVPRPKD